MQSNQTKKPQKQAGRGQGRGQSQQQQTQGVGRGSIQGVGRGQNPPKQQAGRGQGATDDAGPPGFVKSDDIGSFGSKKVDPPPPPIEKVEEPPAPKKTPLMDLEMDCLTCCLPIQYYSVGKCNHNSICSTCVLRMRTLYDEQECPLCKVTLTQVVFTRNSNVKFEQFDLKQLHYDQKSKAYFEDLDYLAEVEQLFIPKCLKCTSVFQTLPQLYNHVKSAHNLNYCKICLYQRKVFLYEKVLYTTEELAKHKREGDPGLNIKPHPVCEFCRKTEFYSDEELYYHCKDLHETCWICDRQGVRYQYFRDYNHLETHFRSRHHFCEDPTCREKKFIVFSSAFELQAHTVACHISSLPRDQQNAARTLEVNFTIRRGGDSDNRNDYRDNRSRETSSQPDRNALSFHPEDIGEDATKPPAATPSQPAAPSTQLSREERTERNIALRKQILAKFNGNKQLLAAFSHKTGSYLQGYITAPEFYAEIINCFGNSDSTKALFLEIAALLPDGTKQQELIAHSQKAEQRNAAFPTLGNEGAAPPPTLTPAYRSVAGRSTESGRVSGKSVQPQKSQPASQPVSGTAAAIVARNSGNNSNAGNNSNSGVSRGSSGAGRGSNTNNSTPPAARGVIGGGAVVSDNRSTTSNNNPRPYASAAATSGPGRGGQKNNSQPKQKPKVGAPGVIGGGIIVEDNRGKK